MRDKRVLSVTLVAVVAILLAACSPFGGAATKTVYVGPYQADCEGVAPQKCLLVKEDPADDWSFYYGQIEGLDYEAGYEYELRISEEKVNNPPPDAPAIRWTLIEVVSKMRSLEGTTWKLDSYLDSQGVLVNVLPGTEATTIFQADQVSGNATCNSYFGVFRLRGERLSVDLGGVTEMYCGPEEIMNQESSFLANLDKAGTYLIVEDTLQISDVSGNVILIFSVLEPASLAGPTWQVIGYNNGRETVVLV
jgi:heat shock protein HslJ